MCEKQNKKSLLSLPIWIVLISLLIIAFGFGCAYDFNISKSIYASNTFVNSKIGGAISNTGLAIGFFVIFTAISSLVISSYVYKDTQKWKTITINVIGILGSIIFLVIILIAYSEWLNVFGNKPIAIIFNIFIKLSAAGGGFCFSWFYLRKFNQETLFKTMFWLIVFFASLSILRSFLCMLWSRPRPKLVFDTSSGEAYKPVWILDPFAQLKKAEKYHSLRKSFPSGHTAMSTLTFGLAVALYKLKAYKTDKIAYITLSSAILIFVLTGLGRMIAGWHFLTDISFGAIMGISFMVGFQATINKRF